jgi:hypothetical protein
MTMECLRRNQPDRLRTTSYGTYSKTIHEPVILGLKMAREFILEKVEWFDDVVVDQGRGRVRGTSLTTRMIGDVFEKWVVFHVRGDVGTYMNSVKLEPLKSDGEPQYLRAGIATIVLGETTAIIGKVVLRRPVPGTYTLTLYLGDTTIGTTELQL